MDKTSFGFPFKIGVDGRVASVTGDDNIRGKIIQVLFTSPGERVNMPEFGCGLRDLVFDPNNEILDAMKGPWNHMHLTAQKIKGYG